MISDEDHLKAFASEEAAERLFAAAAATPVRSVDRASGVVANGPNIRRLPSAPDRPDDE